MKQIDLFALGVLAFVMVIGTAPFVEARRNDQFYRMMYLKDKRVYWNRHSAARHVRKELNE